MVCALNFRILISPIWKLKIRLYYRNASWKLMVYEYAGGFPVGGQLAHVAVLLKSNSALQSGANQ